MGGGIVENPKIIVFIIISILFMVGLFILLSGILRYQKSRKYIRTDGTILVKKGFQLDYGKPNVRYHVGEYTYTYTSPIRQNTPVKHGKKVHLLYHPNDPSQAMIDTFIQRGGGRIIGGSILIILCITSIPLIWIIFTMQNFIPN